MRPKTFRLAFISGASSGLGKALCHRAAARGIPLFITGRDAQALAALADTLIVPVEWMALDLCNPRDLATLLERLKKLCPDLIINNAGCGLYGAALGHSTREQLEILEINAKVPMEISLELARALIQQGASGTLLNVSSAAAFFAYPTFSVYAAAKGCIKQFSLAFDQEIAPYGVRCLCACPGQIATPFRARAAKGHPQKRSGHALSADSAAKKIFEQIDKDKAFLVFPLSYKVAIWISHLLPRTWIQALLARALQSRHPRANDASVRARDT